MDAMGEPHTPPSGTKRGRQIVVVENSVECSPLPVPSSAHHGSRSVRRRRDGDSPSADAYEFRVYLPNKTSVEMKLDFATCKNLTVQEFVERIEQSLNRGDNTKQKQRDIVWKNKGNFYITDFQGKRVPDEKGIFTSLADEFKSGRGLLLHVSLLQFIFENHVRDYSLHLKFQSYFFAEVIKSCNAPNNWC